MGCVVDGSGVFFSKRHKGSKIGHRNFHPAHKAREQLGGSGNESLLVNVRQIP
jgi:hypothetical protein